MSPPFSSEGFAQISTPMAFTDVTATSGIDLVIEQQPPRTGTGIGVMYWDDDAYPDLIMSGGTSLELSVYRNTGDMTFERINKDVSGLWFVEGDPRGLAIADFDNDGDSDFFLASWSEGKQSYLFVNEGGKFTKTNKKVGISVDGIATGGSWGDLDNDGDLDLYVGRYYSEQNQLFRNNGDGTFTDVTIAVGLDQALLDADTLTFQSMWVDMNRDGLVDLYEMNDRCYNGFSHNRVWINYDGILYDESESFGLDLCFDAMAIGVHDYNHDGFFDFFHTNVPEGHFLLKGGCDGYTDQTIAAGITTEQWGWGVIFDDLNHDRFPDLFIAHAGYVNYEDANQLFQGRPGEQFKDVSLESDVHLGTNNSATVVRADFDLDGDQDLIVGGIEGDSHSVLRNDSVSGHFLVVELVGTTSNRDAIGALVDVYAGPVWERRPRVSSDVFGGNNDPGLLFGLGDVATVDRIVVHWPSGLSEQFPDVGLDMRMVLEEGTGEAWSLPVWHERCGDLIDNDCNGMIDEGFPVGTPCEVGVGECAVTGVWVCSLDRLDMVCQATPALPEEEIPGDGKDNDCDGITDEMLEEPSCDGFQELCGDGIDNDCDGETDEGFGQLNAPCFQEVFACVSLGTWVCPQGGSAQLMCTAELPQLEMERCGDGVDNDCDGSTDEGFGIDETCFSGVGACKREGERVCDETGFGTYCNAIPGLGEQESCGDGIDNDCDGAVDEGFPVGTACLLAGCDVPGTWVCGDDLLSARCIPSGPFPLEKCGDGKDNDCDGEVDESFPVGEECWLGEGTCRRKGARICAKDGLSTLCDVVAGIPSLELAGDGLDNDCDGETDESFDAVEIELSSDQLDVPNWWNESTADIESEEDVQSGCAVGGEPPVVGLLCWMMLWSYFRCRQGLSSV